MKRRAINLFTALFLILPLALGMVQAQDDIVLRVMVRPDEGGNVALYAQRFEEETGIQVEVDFVGWGEIYSKTVTTLAAGGGGFDIAFIPSANAIEFISAGWFAPIDGAIAEEDQGDWLQSVLDLYTYEGSLYAMPWYAGGAHFTANGAALAEAGIDVESIATWEDVAAACEALIEADAVDYCFTPSAKYPGNFYYSWGTMAASSGIPLFNDDGTPNFEETGLAAFEWLADGVNAGFVNPAGIALDDYETLIEFGTGTSGFMINSTWSVTQAAVNEELSSITGDTVLMLIPGWEGGDRSGGHLYAGGLGVVSASEHPEEAIQFLQFLTSEEAQKHHAIEGSNLPTRMALYEDEDIAASWTGFEVLAEQLTYGFFPPQFTWFEEWRLSAASAAQDVIAGRRTPEDAVDFLVAEAERLSAE
jgi:multiple sugar transport system substrate-binding protein